MVWQTNGTPDTLASSGDLLSIPDMDAQIFNVFPVHLLPTGGTIDYTMRLNSDSNAVYARRQNNNGAEQAPVTSETSFPLAGGFANTEFGISYFISVDGEDKLLIGNMILSGTAGANSPSKRNYVGKYVPSPDVPVTECSFVNVGTGDYNIGSNLSALGTD